MTTTLSPFLYDAVNEHRLTAPTGWVRSDIERIIRNALIRADNRRLVQQLKDHRLVLCEIGEGIRAYCVGDYTGAFSVRLETQPLMPRVKDRMRRAVRADIQTYKDARFAADPAPRSPLSNTVLINDRSTHVDHCPRKFRSILFDFEQEYEIRDWRAMDDPNAPLLTIEWPKYHRFRVDWDEANPAETSGLRLLTARESILAA
ncbi:hypothetical protein [uncultured Tessaracoccus sp.]|uniref:hypothetical protein n=1 Tax=uncultured Tessaracoccus sp. TaxID=905023 RepID=UPI0026376059|nr:hypothetical protein [uncultured Tessaracoccus sp.]